MRRPHHLKGDSFLAVALSRNGLRLKKSTTSRSRFFILFPVRHAAEPARVTRVGFSVGVCRCENIYIMITFLRPNFNTCQISRFNKVFTGRHVFSRPFTPQAPISPRAKSQIGRLVDCVPLKAQAEGAQRLIGHIAHVSPEWGEAYTTMHIYTKTMISTL